MDESNQNQVASNEANTTPTLQAFSSNKIAAGICGSLTGSLGIHKFILGLTTPGIIMVLVTVLTCGVGGLVMSIIGFIEGVISLPKTEQHFLCRLLLEKKPWF